ncbi:MAG: CpsD/CapB family tyrosine-protein kinase [Candidatus Omnitrophota bacterium]
MRYLFGRIASFFTPPVYVVKKPKAANGVDGRILAYTDNNSTIAEQYRVLRTNLYSFSPEKPIKTILLTSSQSEEGKTLTSVNLAYTLSLDIGKKVILIDSDLRRPAVHKMLGCDRKPGFADILSGKADIEYFLSKPAFGNLHVIPTGTIVDNPSEMLSSGKIKDLLEILKARFDYIIFDTPPVINVTDASVLGSICDAVFLVVKAGVTPKDMVEESYNMLKRAQAQPKATILTNVIIPIHQYYRASYRYYYRYRYGHGRRV